LLRTKESSRSSFGVGTRRSLRERAESLDLIHDGGEGRQSISQPVPSDKTSFYRGARDARTITSREIIARLDSIVARGDPVMANRTAAILTQMFRFGCIDE
jgi:hypothetical protein